jgi:type VI secretion system protein ImpL
MNLQKDIVRIVLAGIGITSIAALVYYAGPLIAFGDFHPFQNYIIREITILLLITAAASVAGFRFFRHRRAAKALTDGVSEAAKKESDEVILKDKMKDALATLKSAGGGKKDYLYDLPWLGQDDRPDQFRAQIPAVARRHAGGDRRCRRHALLRLVVHRRGGPD